MRESKARAICTECPVLEPCRDWAREQREYGFWGGESEEERAAAGFRVDMPVGRVARYPKGNGKPVAARAPRGSPDAPTGLRSGPQRRHARERTDGRRRRRAQPPKASISRACARSSPSTSRAPATRPLTAELIAGGRSNLTYASPTASARGCCAARRSGTSCRPRTTWPASTGS